MRISTPFLRATTAMLFALAALYSFVAPLEADATDSTKPPAKGDKDQVVAEVNGSKITYGQLDKELKKQLGPKIGTFDDEQLHVLRGKMLQTLVNRQLLLQDAETHSLTPTEEDVDHFMASLRKNLPGEDGLKAELDKYGVSEDAFRAQMAEDLTVKRYLDKRVFQSIVIDEKELREEYERDTSRFKQEEEVRARHILLKVPSDAPEEKVAETEKKIKEIRARLDKPDADFAAEARAVSEAQNAGKGGNIGFFTRNQLPKVFTDVAFELELNQISQPVRTEHGFHIIKVEEKREDGIKKFEDVEDRVRSLVLRKKREEALAKHFESLRSKNKVIIYYH